MKPTAEGIAVAITSLDGQPWSTLPPKSSDEEPKDDFVAPAKAWPSGTDGYERELKLADENGVPYLVRLTAWRIGSKREARSE